MGELLKSLNEHSGIIILILGAFSVWSLKRILGKIESNLETLSEDQEEHRKEDVKIHAGIYDRINGIDGRLSTLQGEHQARHSGGK